MRRYTEILAVLALSAGMALHAQTNEMVIQTRKLGAEIQPTMYGLFFEDINYAADGGLYAELVKNRSFEFPQHLMGWKTYGKVTLQDDGPFERNPHYVRLSDPGHGHKHTGLDNEGFFGVGVKEGEEYRFSVWARLPQGGTKATLRIDKIESDLNETAQAIKDLNLENVGQNIEVMTEDMNLLYADFEKEQNAYALYEEKRDACYKYVNTIDSGLSKTRDVIKDLEKNYILSDYEITIEDDYKEFQKVLNDLNDVTEIIESKDFSYQDMIENFERITINSKPFNDSLIKHNELAESLKIQEKRALDELDNINIVLLEIKSEIRNKHLPMISESYQDYIDDSYQKADAILNFIRQRPIDLKSLSMQVDAARDVIYKLYDNVHNLIVTAEMVEDAIIFGNRYRSSFLEVNTELTKAELLYRNGEYTKALSTAVDIIEKIKPDSYEMLVNKKSPKNA